MHCKRRFQARTTSLPLTAEASRSAKTLAMIHMHVSSSLRCWKLSISTTATLMVSRKLGRVRPRARIRQLESARRRYASTSKSAVGPRGRRIRFERPSTKSVVLAVMSWERAFAIRALHLCVHSIRRLELRARIVNRLDECCAGHAVRRITASLATFHSHATTAVATW